MNHLHRMADFVSSLEFESLPREVVRKLKWSVLDTLGCGLYGSRTPWGRIAADYAAARGAGPSALWGRQQSTDAANAALANGTMAHGFELDDVHAASRSHPGAVTLPVALALAAESGGVSGRELLAALAAGYEVTVRVGMCQGVSAFNRGWHPTGTAGAFGAAAAASRLLGFDPETTRNCLGIGGTMPAGLMAAQYGAMVKRLFVGHAGFAGVLSARLAERGFTGIADIFDAGFGGYPGAVSDSVDLGVLSRDLGRTFEAGNVGYKFYACVGTNLTALDAVREILDREPVPPSDVEAVRIRTSAYQKLHSGWDYRPSTVMAAQMNMQYCVAAMLVDGDVFVDQFAEDRIRDPQLLELASRVTVDVDPTIDAQSPVYRGAEVDLVLRGGRVLSARRDVPKGHALNPPTWDDLVRKFRALAGRVLPEGAVSEVVRFVETLEQAPDVAALPRLLAGAEPPC